MLFGDRKRGRPEGRRRDRDVIIPRKQLAVQVASAVGDELRFEPGGMSRRQCTEDAVRAEIDLRSRKVFWNSRRKDTFDAGFDVDAIYARIVDVVERAK